MGSPGIGASSGEPGGMLTGSSFPGKPGGGGSGLTGSGVGAGTSGRGSEGEGVPTIRTDPFISWSAATGGLSLIKFRRATVHGSFRQYRPRPGRLEFSSLSGSPGRARSGPSAAWERREPMRRIRVSWRTAFARGLGAWTSCSFTGTDGTCSAADAPCRTNSIRSRRRRSRPRFRHAPRMLPSLWSRRPFRLLCPSRHPSPKGR